MTKCGGRSWYSRNKYDIFRKNDHNTINSNWFLVILQSNELLHQVLNTHLSSDLAVADLVALSR